MVSPGVREATPQKNPQSPREKGAECELDDLQKWLVKRQHTQQAGQKPQPVGVQQAQPQAR